TRHPQLAARRARPRQPFDSSRRRPRQNAGEIAGRRDRRRSGRDQLGRLSDRGERQIMERPVGVGSHAQTISKHVPSYDTRDLLSETNSRGGQLDGIHDMGGTHGWGTVEIDPDEPVFAEPWEGKAFAFGAMSPRLSGTNLDAFRHGIDRQHPHDYL